MEARFAFLIALFFTALLASNIYFFRETASRRSVLITEITDGDTMVISTGEKLRLLNINTPEKNEPGYLEAKNFLASYVNMSVEIEEEGLDKYNRLLVRVYAPEYLNLHVVSDGLAKKFLVEKTETSIFAEAEREAVNNSKGLWQKSEYFGCFDANIDPFSETIFLESNCGEISLDNWLIQDESRKKYKFQKILAGGLTIHTTIGEDNSTDVFIGLSENMWNNDRDTFYLFDSNGGIVHHEDYGY